MYRERERDGCFLTGGLAKKSLIKFEQHLFCCTLKRSCSQHEPHQQKVASSLPYYQKIVPKLKEKLFKEASLSQTKHLKPSLCVCVCLFFSTCTKLPPKKNHTKTWVFQTWWVVEVEPLRGCRGSEYSAWRLKLWHPNSKTNDLESSGSDRSLETHTHTPTYNVYITYMYL